MVLIWIRLAEQTVSPDLRTMNRGFFICELFGKWLKPPESQSGDREFESHTARHEELSSSGRKTDFHSVNRSSILRSSTKIGVTVIYIMGHPARVTTDRQCTRSITDHITLRNEARVARQERGFDVDDSFVLCMQCGQAIPLQV